MRIVIVLDAPTTPLDPGIATIVAKEAARLARSKTPGGSLPVDVVEAYVTESLSDADIEADYARVGLVEEFQATADEPQAEDQPDDPSGFFGNFFN